MTREGLQWIAAVLKDCTPLGVVAGLIPATSIIVAPCLPIEVAGTSPATTPYEFAQS